VAAGLGGLNLPAGQRRGFKDPLEAQCALVIWLFGGTVSTGPCESTIVSFDGLMSGPKGICRKAA